MFLSNFKSFKKLLPLLLIAILFASVANVFLIPPKEARAAIAYVQSAKNTAASTATTVGATWGTATTAGNLLVATLHSTNPTALTFGAPAGWTEALTSTDASGPYTKTVIFYYENAPSQSSTGNFTTSNQPGSGIALIVAEYSGIATSSALDKTAQNSGSSTISSTGTTATTTQADELLIGGLGVTAGSITFSDPTNSFTIVDQQDNTAAGSDAGNAFLYRIISSTGDYSTGATNTNGPWAGVIATFKAGAAAVTTIADGTDPDNSSIAPSGAATEVDAFTLATDSGTDTVTAATVTLASGTHAGLSLVEITNSAGSTVYCSETDPADVTVSLTSCAIPVTTSTTTFKVRITPKSHANMPAPAGTTYSVTGTITAFTSTNTQAGTDTDSATVTIDNTSPSNVTSPTATGGDAQASLSWTNPADSDFHSTVVLRRASSATSDTPTEGTTYIVGDIVGSSTVACVVSTPTATCTDTGLTNGTAYHYRIYAKDSNVNYSATGEVPTGSPVTPVGGLVVGGGGGGGTDPNAKGTITVTKKTNGGEGTFNFITTGEGYNSFDITTSNGTGSNSQSLLPGIYTVVEDTTIGWSKSSDTCSGEISVVSNQTTNCTISNTLSYPNPSITSLSPSSATVGSTDLTLTINGDNFVPVSQVKWNNIDRTTTYISPTQLTIVIPASDLLTLGDFNITVTNPAPGGGASAASIFKVTTNLVPVITSLSRTSIPIDSAEFTLTINGLNFIATSIARFNNSDRTTTYLSSTTLEALILGSDLKTLGYHAITVFNPTSGTETTGFKVTKNTQGGNDTFSFNATNKTFYNSNFTITTALGTGSTTQLSLLPGTYYVTETVPAGWNKVEDNCGTLTVVLNEITNCTVANTKVATPNNPVPVVANISPTVVIVGGPSFTMTVNGRNFISSSKVRFSNTNRTTTYISATQLKATITASDISRTGTYNILVNNPTPGGGNSNVKTLSVNNPVPSITSLSKLTVSPSGFNLTITGKKFIASSQVKFSGTNITTTYISATQLKAVIPLSYATKTGAVTVVNPAPGGGASSAKSLRVVP